VRGSRVWKVLLGVERTVIESVDLEIDAAGREQVVARVRPTRRQQLRCPHCRRTCRRVDAGDGRRRWRGLDLGTVQTFLDADAPRVACRDHGIVVAHVPWARHDSRFTTGFEDTAAWLAAHASASTIAELLRSSWRAITGIVTRVVTEARGHSDRLTGLRWIGIDEIAHRKGHRYLLIVTCHETGRVVWAHPGRNQDTVRAFFDALGPERAAQLTQVSCDGAEWIHDVIRERAPRAVICLDPFHAVQWITDAIDEVRRRIARELRAAGRDQDAAALKGSRWALLKNPDNLTGAQATTLASIKTTNGPLYRALPDERATPRSVRPQGNPRSTPAPRGHLLDVPLEDPRNGQDGKGPAPIPRPDRPHHGSRAQQRPRGSNQHPHPAAHPPCLRLPQPRSPHRHGRTHPRRPLPSPARPSSLNVDHGTVSRPTKFVVTPCRSPLST
jgi:transposase